MTLEPTKHVNGRMCRRPIWSDADGRKARLALQRCHFVRPAKLLTSPGFFFRNEVAPSALKESP
jgi:hypothetical protein